MFLSRSRCASSSLSCLKRALSRRSSNIPLQGRNFSSPSSRGEWRSNGTLEFSIAGGIVAVVVVEQTLQYLQQQEQQSLRRQLEEVEKIEIPNHPRKIWAIQEPRYEARVTQVDKSMNGDLIMKDVLVGDVVEIVKENASAQADYVVCRKKNENGEIVASGWYPAQWIQRLPKQEGKK